MVSERRSSLLPEHKASFTRYAPLEFHDFLFINMNVWRRLLRFLNHSSNPTSEQDPEGIMAKTRSQTHRHNDSSKATTSQPLRGRVTKAPLKAAARVKKAVLLKKRTKTTTVKQAPQTKHLHKSSKAGKTDKAGAKDALPAPVPKAKGPRDCNTCSDHRPATAFRIRTPTAECQHASLTCRTCVSRWISTQLESGRYDEIACPECPQILQKNDIMAFGTKASRTRYEYLANLDNLSKQKGFVRCMNQNCDSGQIHGYKNGKKLKPQDPHFICRTCKTQYCRDCKTDWHHGKLCIEMFAATPAEKKKQEAESQKMVEKTAKKCPNKKCARPIEKRSGCNHMQCMYLPWPP